MMSWAGVPCVNCEITLPGVSEWCLEEGVCVPGTEFIECGTSQSE